VKAARKEEMEARKRRKNVSTATTSSSDQLEAEIGLSLSISTSCRLVRYHVKEGHSVSIGDLLASCEVKGQADLMEFRSPVDGDVIKLIIDEDERFDGCVDGIVRIRYCVHNVIVSALCAICGRTVESAAAIVNLSSGEGSSKTKRDTATVNVEGGLRLEVTRDEALKVRESTVTRLIQSRRLSLVLDLDHTLVHCTDDPKAMYMAQTSQAAAEQLYSFELDHKFLVLKLRPGLLGFLKRMKENYFEMYVYTAGTRIYANKVCSIMDPTGAIFGERIISRDDTPELGMDKDLTRLFPVDDTMVVVVDDRDVWSGVANLLTCQPFDYFRGMHDVNNTGWKTMSGDDASEKADDQDASNAATTTVRTGTAPVVLESEEMDRGLARVETILKQIHRTFYFSSGSINVQRQLEGAGQDVKIILRDIKLSVMRKVVLAFDPEVKPRHSGYSERYLESLFAKAKACGATLVDIVDAKTTHLVSCAETALANYGKQLGIWVIRPEWLERSEHFWERVKEEPYSVFRTYGTRPKLYTSSSAAGESAKLSAEESQNVDGQSNDALVVEEAGEEEDLEDFADQLAQSVKAGNTE